MPETVKELIEALPGQFNADAWGSEDAVLNLQITGPQGGNWVARIENGQLSLAEGAAENARMTMTTSDEDLLAMVNGSLNPVSAFMGGRVKIDGDMSLAMKLQTLLGG